MRKELIILVSSCISITVCAQNGGDQKSAQEALTAVTWISKNLFPLLSSVVLLAMIIGIWLNSKKIAGEAAKAAIEKNAENVVRKYFAERLHVAPATVTKFFQEYEEEQNKLGAQTIYVVFNPNTKNQADFITYLQNKGFKGAKRVSLKDKIEGLTGNEWIVFFDEDGKMISDQEIDNFAKEYRNFTHLFYFGPRRYEGENQMKNFANTRSTLTSRLRDIFLA